MAIEREPNNNRNSIHCSRMISETALEWFDRCQKRNTSGCRKRRRSNDPATESSRNNEESLEPLGFSDATDASTAAWRLLQLGKSGIAPIDAAWKRSVVQGRSERARRGQSPPSFLPPVTILEGPKDVGKTWMLLTLAARFVVATRASRFNEFALENTNENETERSDGHNDGIDSDNGEADVGKRNCDRGRPKVLLLDSAYDLSVPQLVNIVRVTLMRERQKEKKRSQRITQRGRQSQGARQHATTMNQVSDQALECSGDKRNHYQLEPQQRIEDELERQEQEKISLEEDVEDCLSRIHIIQVDNGPTGWVPMLEAITYQLSDDCDHRNRYNDTRNTTPTARTPTLFLWDGFLSDMSLSTNAMMAQKASVVLAESAGGSYYNPQVLFDSPSTQELLIQLSRLLQKHSEALWFVLTTRTVPVTVPPTTTNDTASGNNYSPVTMEQSGIGLRLIEWIKKEEEKWRREKDPAASIRYNRPNLPHTKQQQEQQQQQQQHRASYRIRLDRRYDYRADSDGHIPSTTAAAAALFAKVIGGGESTNDGGGNFKNPSANDEKIPYSISIGGILS